MPASLKASGSRVARREQTVEVKDMTGGVNLRLSPTLVPADQARMLRNYSLEEPGALIMRLGNTRYSSGTFGPGRAQGGQRIYLSSIAPFTLVAHNSTLYKVNDAGVGSTVLSGLSTNQIFFAYDRDIVVEFDGANRPRKSTNGSSWVNFGIDAPLAGPTASTLSSGVVSSGEYALAYTYKQRSQAYESNVSSESTITLTASTGALKAVAVASTDVQVDAYVWYGRDISAGETILRKISSGAASSARFTSTNWTANAEAPTNHNVLSAGKFGIVWKNRWWVPSASVSNRLHFSELFLPQAFPALFYVDIPFRYGDSIAAVAPNGDTLIVFGQSGEVFLIIGQTSLDFEVRPSAGAIAGALGQRAWCKVEQGIVHASAEGVHVFDGATDRLLSFDIDTAWRDFIANTAGSELAKTAMTYEFRRKCIRIAIPRIYPRATAGELELNLDRTRQSNREAWSDTDRKIGGYIPFDGNELTAGFRGEVVTWNDTTGILYKESTGTSDNSSNMTAEYDGPSLALGLHRARVHGLHVEYEPHAGNLTSETIIDGISQGAISLAIGAGLAQYGTAIYGTALYGGSGRRKAYTPQKLSAEGRTITNILTYVGQERIRLFTYAYDILPETRVRTFTE